MGGIGKLSAAKVRTLIKPGRYGDGGGLWLQVTPAQRKNGGEGEVTKAWLFRFMLGGRERQMGLGGLDTWSLAEARELAREARQQVKRGIDPIEARREQKTTAKIEAARGPAPPPRRRGVEPWPPSDPRPHVGCQATAVCQRL